MRRIRLWLRLIKRKERTPAKRPISRKPATNMNVAFAPVTARTTLVRLNSR